jgi:hypothetical protein
MCGGSGGGRKVNAIRNQKSRRPGRKSGTIDGVNDGNLDNITEHLIPWVVPVRHSELNQTSMLSDVMQLLSFDHVASLGRRGHSTYHTQVLCTQLLVQNTQRKEKENISRRLPYRDQLSATIASILYFRSSITAASCATCSPRHRL